MCSSPALSFGFNQVVIKTKFLVLDNETSKKIQFIAFKQFQIVGGQSELDVLLLRNQT